MQPTYDHPAAIDPDQLLKACRVHRGRSGGPGGQHRNKVETAVRILHEPTGIEGQAGERRSQAENHHVALFRLRVKLAVEHRAFLRRFAMPSDRWTARCRDGQVVINPSHADFPAILAEAMDFIADGSHDVKKAAARLGCTPTQLIKLLKIEPAALARVNAARREHGLGELR